MKNENRIIPKPHLKLLKIGRKHMIVASVDNGVNMADVYTMNETAAWMWRTIGEQPDSTPESLAEGLSRGYGVDYDRVLRDVEAQLLEWKQMGLLV